MSISAEGMVLLDKVRRHANYRNTQWAPDTSPGSRSSYLEINLRRDAAELGITVTPEEVAAYIEGRNDRRDGGDSERGDDGPITAADDPFAPRFA